jgi:TolB-like protein/Flp pilus assembly protein TadD
MTSILRDQPAYPTSFRSDVPAALAELVMSCLEKEPGLRPDATQLSEKITVARRGQESEATETMPSVAVLPFADMSPEQDQGYFCDGMAEEIINTLAKLDGLHVAPRTSSFRFRGSDAGSRAIASQLNVSTLLEGSVRKAGNQLRITAQLIDAADEKHLWSERYDRQLDDIFTIQDDIAQSIVQALQITLSPGESSALKHTLTDQAVAYDFYLRGRQYFFRNSKRDHLYARQMFNRAIEVDPSFTRAYAGFADSSAYIYKHYGHDQALLDEADAASRKALELDPELPEAHTSRGIVQWLCGNLAEADREFQAALDLDDTIFETHFVYGNYCYSCGRLEEAVDVFRRAEAIRPEDFQSPILLGSLYRGLGRDQEMRTAFQRGFEIARDHLALTPDDPRAAYLAGAALVALGEADRGLEWAERARRLDAENPFLLYNMAAIYAGAGRIAKAIDYLESAIAHGWSHMDNLHNDPDFDPLRDHPRFAALLQR